MEENTCRAGAGSEFFDCFFAVSKHHNFVGGCGMKNNLYKSRKFHQNLTFANGHYMILTIDNQSCDESGAGF